MRALFLAAVVCAAACSRSPATTSKGHPAASASVAARATSATARAPNAAPASSSKPTPPPGFVEATVAGAPSVGAGHAVLLVDPEQKRAVPIFVGGSEGLSIGLRLTHDKAERPLTHDLFDSALGKLGASVHSARVVKLENGTYFGMLVLVKDGHTVELDSRASDAVAMALGAGVPIFLATRVLEQAGIPLESLTNGIPKRPLPRDEIAL